MKKFKWEGKLKRKKARHKGKDREKGKKTFSWLCFDVPISVSSSPTEKPKHGKKSFDVDRKFPERQLARCRIADLTSTTSPQPGPKTERSRVRSAVDADEPSLHDGSAGHRHFEKNFSKINYDGHWTGCKNSFIHLLHACIHFIHFHYFSFSLASFLKLFNFHSCINDVNEFSFDHFTISLPSILHQLNHSFALTFSFS